MHRDTTRRPLLRGKLLGLYVLLTMVAIALAVGWLTPEVIPLNFLQENGPVERSTVWVCALAALCVLLCNRRGACVLDTASACILLLAMAMREQDLHSAMFGISILKSRFYLGAPLWQIAVALAMLLPIVGAGAWLVKRYARQWLPPLSQWNAPMVTLALMLGAMVFAKVADRTPATLDEWGLLDQVAPALLPVLLSLEEILEWSLPVFAIIAALQIRKLRGTDS